MSLEHDVTILREDEIFKPASKRELGKRKRTAKKMGYGVERVYINQYLTEDGQELYSVEGYDQNGQPTYRKANICPDSGFFIDSDELDQWLEDNKDEIEVVEDFRDSAD